MKKVLFRSWLSSSKFKKLSIFFLLISIVCTTILPGFAIGTTGVLSGKVIDKDTRKPIENAYIIATSSSDAYSTSTDSNGFFSIAGIPANSYDVTLERVGYETALYKTVLVTGDATTSLDFSLVSQAVQVQGVTVTATRAPMVNPHQTMTNYGYTSAEIDKLLPGPEHLNLFGINDLFPGVLIGYDSVYGLGFSHIRGGTGSDVGYSFDGVPITEYSFNGLGSSGDYIGTAQTDFYVGGYPPQYGSFVSGFYNQIAPRGSGPLHGSIEYSYGFWLDPGSHLPSYDPATGTIPTYNGQAFYGPTNISIELQGKDRKFSYYINHVIQDGGALENFNGVVPYASGVDIKPQLRQLGPILFDNKLRDTVMNFTYDLDNYNNLQLLYFTTMGYQPTIGFQELSCNPAFALPGSCTTNNSATGFGETFNAFNIAPLPDSTIYGTNDLEKFEWTHRFRSPGKVLSLRLWKANSFQFIDEFSQPVAFWASHGSFANGGLIQYQDQLTDQHLLNLGASYLYSKNPLYSETNNLQYPASLGTVLTSQGLLYPPGGIPTFHTVAVPDNQTMAGWISDEWRPTSKLTFFGGLRFDRQNNVLQSGVNGTPFAIAVPGYVNGTPMDPGVRNPGLISPRLGASYEFSDDSTFKASFGRFVTFAPVRRVERITGTQDSPIFYYSQGVSSFRPGFAPPTGTNIIPAGAFCPDPAGCYQFPSGTAEWLGGSQIQRGENIDISWEYRLNNNSFFKMTPYVKHIFNPIEQFTVNGIPNAINGGVIASKGIEFLLKTRDWHNLSGWLSYTYSSTKGSQLPFEADLLGSPVAFCPPTSGCSAGGPFNAATALALANQMVPTDYDERHYINLVLNYKVGKWEIAPNFTYGSGFPYGLGVANLQAIAALQDPRSFLYGGPNTIAQSVAAAGFTNPLNESGFNSLRHPGWWLGNLAVSYHFNANLTGTLNIYNLFNSNQILTTDNTAVGGIGYGELTNPNLVNSSLFAAPCCYASNDGSQNILPQYNPLKGQYAPFGYPNLREYWLTLHYNY